MSSNSPERTTSSGGGIFSPVTILSPPKNPLGFSPFTPVNDQYSSINDEGFTGMNYSNAGSSSRSSLGRTSYPFDTRGNRQSRGSREGPSISPAQDAAAMALSSSPTIQQNPSHRHPLPISSNTSALAAASSSSYYFEGIDVQVSDYYYVQPGKSYDDHFFVLTVCIEDLKYSVDRSYVDFVELHRRLVKCLPYNNLPELPLKAKDEIEKQILSSLAAAPLTSSSSSSSGSSSIRESLLTTDKKKTSSNLSSSSVSYPIPSSSTEAMPSLKKLLTSYLSNLLLHDEVLTSDIIFKFFDEEYSSLFQTNIPPLLTLHDLILINSKEHVNIVNKYEEKFFDVPKNHFLIWRFSTLKYDIGFSIEVNGEVRKKLTRFPSHEREVCGGILIKNDEHSIAVNTSSTNASSSIPRTSSALSSTSSRIARIKLKFDNSYAKYHSKELHWSVRIISYEEFQQIKKQVVACYCEKKRYLMQRNALKRALMRNSYRLSCIVSDWLIEEEYEENENLSLRYIQDLNSNLTSKYEMISQELVIVRNRVQELEEMRKIMKESLDNLTLSWKYSINEVENKKKIIEGLMKTILEYEEILNDFTIQTASSSSASSITTSTNQDDSTSILQHLNQRRNQLILFLIKVIEGREGYTLNDLKNFLLERDSKPRSFNDSEEKNEKINYLHQYLENLAADISDSINDCRLDHEENFILLSEKQGQLNELLSYMERYEENYIKERGINNEENSENGGEIEALNIFALIKQLLFSTFDDLRRHSTLIEKNGILLTELKDAISHSSSSLLDI